MAKRTKRQHVVSRFYLNGFANEVGVLSRLDLQTGKSNPVSVGDANVIKDFYTVELPDGTKSDLFEKAFSSVEGEAANALDSLLSGAWPLTGRPRVALATWFALQHLRAEQIRDQHTQMKAEMTCVLVGVSGKEPLRRHIAKHESRDVPDDELDAEWDDLTKPGGPDLTPSVEDHIRTIVDLADGFGSYLAAGTWMRAEYQRRSIITSDTPVSMVPTEDHLPFLGVGLANAGLFVVPVSRRSALTIQPHWALEDQLGAGKVLPDYKVSGTTRLARATNQETALRVRKYLFHHPDDDPLSEIHLPDRTELPRVSASDTDHFIREEGIAPEGPPESTSPLREVPHDDEDSITLKDLPWPIPGRRSLS